MGIVELKSNEIGNNKTGNLKDSKKLIVPEIHSGNSTKNLIDVSFRMTE